MRGFSCRVSVGMRCTFLSRFGYSFPAFARHEMAPLRVPLRKSDAGVNSTDLTHLIEKVVSSSFLRPFVFFRSRKKFQLASEFPADSRAFGDIRFLLKLTRWNAQRNCASLHSLKVASDENVGTDHLAVTKRNKIESELFKRRQRPDNQLMPCNGSSPASSLLRPC